MALTRRRVLLDVRHPVLPRLEPVMRRLGRPRPLDQVLCPRALGDDLVAEAARLGQHLDVERIRQVAAVDDGHGRRVGAAQRHGAARPRAEQLRDHAEGVLPVGGEPVVLLGPAVALGREELDVGLRRREPHGVAPGLARRRRPQLRVGEALVEARKGEGAEREGRQEALLLVLPQLVRLVEGVAVVHQVVVGQPGLVRLVEDEDDLSGQPAVFLSRGGRRSRGIRGGGGAWE